MSRLHRTTKHALAIATPPWLDQGEKKRERTCRRVCQAAPAHSGRRCVPCEDEVYTDVLPCSRPVIYADFRRLRIREPGFPAPPAAFAEGLAAGLMSPIPGFAAAGLAAAKGFTPTGFVSAGFAPGLMSPIAPAGLAAAIPPLPQLPGLAAAPSFAAGLERDDAP